MEVISLLGDHEVAASQQRSKALHRAVTSQEKAQKELLRVQDARRAYLAAWADYTANLQKLLQKQQTEQEKAMDEFGANEQHWKTQLQEATTTLAALTGEGQEVDLSDADEDKNAEMKVDPWPDDVRAGQAELSQVLAKAKEKAETAVKEAAKDKEDKRESSRTPRRAAREVEKVEPPGKAPA